MRYFIVGLLCLLVLKAQGQCILEQLDQTYHVASSHGFGQSFTACSSGFLNEIELLRTTGGSQTIPYELRDQNNSIIWGGTFLSRGGNNVSIINLANGSGTSRFLTSGGQYRIIFPTYRASSAHSSGDFYPGGNLFTINIFGSYSNFNYDIWFRIAIGTSLPVELIVFQSTLKNENIQLHWQTASETNNDYFSIQHSTDGATYNEIGIMEGNGTTTQLNDYEFIHKQPAKGTNYYRLKQVDYDGGYEYSKVISVDYGVSDLDTPLFLSPNPASDQLFLQNEIDQPLSIEIMSITGQLIQTIQLDSKEKRQLDISHLPPGTYISRSENGRKTSFQRFVIQ